MAPNQHKKSHHAHETTDAFAEGWDAREAAIATGRAESINPYRVELYVISKLHSKRSGRQLENMERDAGLWDQGWHERGLAQEE
jgi:hypothetical protein